jgi:signal transduction histidine kinase
LSSSFRAKEVAYVNNGHRASPALLSAAPATTPHNMAALAVMLVVLVVLCATLPFAQRPWTRFPGFILIQQPVQAGNCIIIAALLFGQYSITRTPSLNLLAAGYLFTALMIIAHMLSFPGAFSETGLFPGGVHTTSWLYPAWHTILPMTIIVYTLLPSDQTAERRFAGARYPIVASILLCVGGAAAITFFITAARDRLPVLVEGARLLPASTVVNAALLFLPFAALIALALRRPRSILDLWLVVTMFTWLCTISLVALISAQRFDIGWYVGRALDLLTSTFILLLLLSETLVLYGRHAIAVAAERRERERRLKETEAILVHLSRVNELGHNVSSIVHEVNQPLTAISNYAAASLKLLETSRLEQLKSLLERLVEQTVRANEIIRHLRNFVARHEAEKRAENIPELLRDATQLALDAGREPAPAVEIRCDPDASTGFLDRVQIEQVVFNLMRNATEAMSKSQRRVLTLATKSIADGMIEVSITDTGPGVSADIRATLFEPFVTTKEGGLGIGLSICRVIIEAHGGKLAAKDNPEGGAIFRFTIPRAPISGS